MAQALTRSSVRAALLARGAQEILEAVPTDRRIPLPTLDGTERSAQMWLVRTPGQIWLVAADPRPDAYPGLAPDIAVGTGSAAEVRLDHAFGGHWAVINEVRAPVARARAGAARALIQRFQEAPGGPKHPYDPRLARVAPDDEHPGMAPGAPPGPLAWAGQGGPQAREGGEPWLWVASTGSTVQWPGKVRDVRHPVFVGISPRRLRVLVANVGTAGAYDLEDGLEAVNRLGFVHLEGPGVRLAAPLFGDELAFIAELSAAPPAKRWALTALAQLQRGDGGGATRLAEAALQDVTDAEAALAPVLVAGAASAGQPARAVAHLAQAMKAGAFTDGPAALRRVMEVSETMDPAPSEQCMQRTETVAAEPLRGAPWPPEGPEEMWAAGAATAVAAGLKQPLSPRLPLASMKDKERALRWAAAIEGTAAAWRVAAIACREAGQSAEAEDALTRARELEHRPEDGWLAFAWAVAEGQATLIDEALRSALEDDEDARAVTSVPSPSLLETSTLIIAAERAEALQHPAAPALLDAADQRSGLEGSEGFSARLNRARRLWKVHAAPARAARILLRLADLLDESEAPREPGPGQLTAPGLRLEAAEALSQARAVDEAQEAARAAVAEEYLRPDLLRRAAELETVSVSDKERGWWRHLADVLDGNSETPHPGSAPVPALSAEDLDALHPGGQGWLSDFRTRISIPALPHRDQLTRGLERLEGTRFLEVSALVKELSTAYGLEPVPTYVYRGDNASGVSAWPTSPPVVLIGVEHLEPGPRFLNPAGLRFALAVELAHIAAGHPVLSFDDSILGTSRSVYQALGRFAVPAETAVDLISLVPGIDQFKALKRLLTLSRQLFLARKRVNQASGLAQPLLNRIIPKRGGGSKGLQGAALAFRLQADRAGLRLSGDIRGAVRAILAASAHPSTHLARFDEGGLLAVLSPSSEPSLGLDESLRLAALFEDAAKSGPPGLLKVDVAP